MNVVSAAFFYIHVTRKKAAEMTFVRKICAFNVDEIDTLSQFHQHCMHTLFVRKCFAQFFSSYILALAYVGTKTLWTLKF